MDRRYAGATRTTHHVGWVVRTEERCGIGNTPEPDTVTDPIQEARVSVDSVNIFAAFTFGMLSFLSPCVLPLLPGYMSMMSGYSAADLA